MSTSNFEAQLKFEKLHLPDAYRMLESIYPSAEFDHEYMEHDTVYGKNRQNVDVDVIYTKKSGEVGSQISLKMRSGSYPIRDVIIETCSNFYGDSNRNNELGSAIKSEANRCLYMNEVYGFLYDVPTLKRVLLEHYSDIVNFKVENLNYQPGKMPGVEHAQTQITFNGKCYNVRVFKTLNSRNNNPHTWITIGIAFPIEFFQDNHIFYEKL